VTGATRSSVTTFPATVGPDLHYRGFHDAFVAKVQADGTRLVYAGYIGGGGDDFGNGIAVDRDGNAYIVGTTKTTGVNFPVTVGPDLTHNGFDDAFVAKVRADGTGLVYAGFIGGAGFDEGRGIAVDDDGNAYVVGIAGSSETTFPVTVGPDLTHNGALDAFMAKVRADGTGFVYAGYIGESGAHFIGNSIAVDNAGNAYVTGATGPINATTEDAFVAKVRADGTGFVYTFFIRGFGDDEGYGIAVDDAGNAYVTGLTNATQPNFPVTVGPDLTYNGAFDAFVAKIAEESFNQPPVAVANSYSVAEDTVLTVQAPGVLGNDTDADGDTLAAIVVSGHHPRADHQADHLPGDA
jgi:hypothetical protein